MAIRRDVASLGTPWNATLEWYARAVGSLMGRPLSDRTSWRYLAAIHGIRRGRDGVPGGWVAAGVVAPDEPWPSDGETRRAWDQCQHAGWYFLPWHRGFLWAFEAIVAKAVRDLGGPEDWALPYWNYFDTSNPDARRLPQAFLEPRMPDGTPNPLSAAPRDPSGILGPSADVPVDVTLDAMNTRRFTAAAGTLGFGGVRTDFSHLGGDGPGTLELDPHNLVHVMVGGERGYMSDPDFAALDPIFWLHHCNVDRLWAAWLSRAVNVQEGGEAWKAGPAPRRFEMPDTAGELASFTPADTLPGGSLAPTYDDLEVGTGAPTVIAGIRRMEERLMPASMSDKPPPGASLLGSSTSGVTAGETPGATRVRLSEATAVASAPTRQRMFLNLRNVRGSAATGVLRVSIGVPASADHGAVEPSEVRTVSLFGLAKASEPDGPHAGNGLGVSIDITDAARSLASHLQSGLDELDVRLDHPAAARTGNITVGAITVVSQPE